MKYREDFKPEVGDNVFTIINDEKGKQKKYGKGIIVGIVDEQHVMVNYNDRIYRDKISRLIYRQANLSLLARLNNFFNRLIF